MPDLPSGTVTFLFTDIEGSTRLWEQFPEQMRQAHARHGELIVSCVEQHGGVFVRTRGEGDSTFSVFPTAPQALAACCAFQRALAAEPWPAETPIRVRAALHTGTANLRDEDYNSSDVNRCARLRAIAHGGQTILSQTVYDLVKERLPDSVTLKDMGLHRLKDLSTPEHVWQLCHLDLPLDFPSLNSLDPIRTNLPIQVTSFIGREKEMTELKALMSSTHLLTLTGTGGCGKTRVALQVAADLIEDYPDGVWLVELAALSKGSLVAQSVSSVLGLREEAGCSLTKTIADYLKHKTLLLILDNCEHLVEDCARLADTLLRFCPNVKVLATSRELLNIAGERSWRVPSLLPPDPDRLPSEEKDLSAVLMDYDAVRLFVERARAHRSDFALTRQNGPAVAEVCYRLDGIPLAIELAAARIKVLATEQIATRLDDRFRLLTGGSRMVLPRQQTLRGLLDWSYDLLTEMERKCFCRLSVFAGGWTLAAAETVCAGEGIEDWEVLDVLTSLVDKSLVVSEERGAEARYRLLETVRQYGWERLRDAGELDRIRGRHLGFFLAWIHEVDLNLVGCQQQVWLDRIEREHDNLRATLEYSLDASADLLLSEAGLQLAGALGAFWHIRGYFAEGRRWLEQALLRSTGTLNDARAMAQHGLGVLRMDQGDFAAARPLFEDALTFRREQGDKRGIAVLCALLGEVANRQSDYGAAGAFFEQALGIYRALNDTTGIAACLGDLGNLAWNLSDYASAYALHTDALTLHRQSGNQLSTAKTLTNLAVTLREQGEYVRARSLCEEALAIQHTLGNRAGVAQSLGCLGSIALREGDYVRARTAYEASLRAHRELGNKRGIANGLHALGKFAQLQADTVQAVLLYEESLGLFREIGDRWGIASLLLSLSQTVCHQGDLAAARLRYRESLVLFQELQHKQGVILSLEAFAHLAAERQPQCAAQLWGAAAALREAIGAPLPPNEREEYERDVAAVREALGEEAFSATWVEGRAMSMEQAVAYAMGESTA